MGCHNEVFKVTFKDYDGNVIYETKVKYGGTAKFEGDLPHISADKTYCYPFTGWDKSIKNVTSNLEVTATHGQEYNIEDFDFVTDAKVFQGVETYDDNTTNYIGYLDYMGGIQTTLKESVVEDGEEHVLDFVPLDSELVNFDYSQVNIQEKGTYTLKITAKGMEKEFPLKVVTNTSKWGEPIETFSVDSELTYATGPDFFDKLGTLEFYDGGNCLVRTLSLDEFDPFVYEKVDENVYVIRSEDGNVDCKYEIVDGKPDNFVVSGSMHHISGSYYEWVQFTTATEFTEEKEGYAYIEACVYGGSLSKLTTKYKYDPDTQEVKLFSGALDNGTLKYNPESGDIEFTRFDD